MLGREAMLEALAAHRPTELEVEVRRKDEFLATLYGDAFPEQAPAFHQGMAVHRKYGQPCPVCGEPIQRIAYASRETNYCPGC